MRYYLVTHVYNDLQSEAVLLAAKSDKDFKDRFNSMIDAANGNLGDCKAVYYQPLGKIGDINYLVGTAEDIKLVQDIKNAPKAQE